MSEIENHEFLAYARDVDKLNSLNSEVRALTQKLKTDREKFKDCPAFATQVTDHAALKACERLQDCCNDQAELFADIVNVTDPGSSLSLVVNMKTFLLTILAKAYTESRYIRQESKNNPGYCEYKYVFVIPKWRFPERTLEICAVVEDNNVKTVYFNWKLNHG